jgi:hypothetical protein
MTILSSHERYATLSPKLEPLILRRRQLMLACAQRADQIASKLGVSKSAVSKVIAGKTRSRKIEGYLAKLWKVPVDTVFPEG